MFFFLLFFSFASAVELHISGGFFLVTIAFPVLLSVETHECNILSFASFLFGGFDKECEALEIVTKVNLGQGKNQLFCLFSLLRLKF